MKERGGCLRSFGCEHDFCQAEKAANTDPRTNYAEKYATALLSTSCVVISMHEISPMVCWNETLPSEVLEEVENICRKRQFVHKMFVHNIFAPIKPPPPPNQQNDGFPLEFLLKGPQTELRTLSQNCEQTLQKLRTNRIMNKRVFLINGCFRMVVQALWVKEIPLPHLSGVRKRVVSWTKKMAMSIPEKHPLSRSRKLCWVHA